MLEGGLHFLDGVLMALILINLGPQKRRNISRRHELFVKRVFFACIVLYMNYMYSVNR